MGKTPVQRIEDSETKSFIFSLSLSILPSSHALSLSPSPLAAFQTLDVLEVRALRSPENERVPGFCDLQVQIRGPSCKIWSVGFDAAGLWFAGGFCSWISCRSQVLPV